MRSWTTIAALSIVSALGCGDPQDEVRRVPGIEDTSCAPAALPENYPHWYNQSGLEGLLGEQFAHSVYTDCLGVITASTLGSFDEQAVQRAEQFAQSQGSGIDTLLRTGQGSSAFFGRADLADVVFDDYQDRSIQALDHFFEFVGLNDCGESVARDVSFRLLGSQTRIIGRQRVDDFPMVVVSDMDLQARALYEVTLENGTVGGLDLQGVVGSGETLGKNFFDVDYRIKPAGDGLDSTLSYPDIVVTTGHGALYTYSTVLFEALHAITIPYTMELARREVENVWERAGRPADLSSLATQMSAIHGAHILRDEGIVHALVNHYLRVHGPEIGFSVSEVEELIANQVANPLYRELTFALGVVEEEGPRRALELYKGGTLF